MKKIGAKATRIANMTALMGLYKADKDFAEAAGIPAALVSQLKNGSRDIGDKLARKIETAFGKMPGWLDADHSYRVKEGPASNIADGPVNYGLIPLISWVKAGNFSEVIDNYAPGDADELLPCPMRCGASSFALTVDGPSMEPEYRHGDIIYVDPDRAAANGSHVVAKVPYANEAVFKKLVIDSGKTYLEALNPDWPQRIIEVSGQIEIVGVVFFSGRKR